MKASNVKAVPPESLNQFPGLGALYVAVWRGDMSYFSHDVKDFYLSSGSLAVLALSGQHVWALLDIMMAFHGWLVLMIFQLFPKLAGRAVNCAVHARSFYWILAAGLLTVTCDGSPSMVRTLVFISAAVLLKLFVRNAGAVQILFSATALLCLWNPAMVLQIGFILSFFGTLFLIVFGTEGAAAFFFFPVLMYPLLLYCFGQVSLSAPLLCGFMDLVWGVVWIPLGFLLPVLCTVLKTGFPMPLFEKVFVFFLQTHSWFLQVVRVTLVRCAVPTLSEVILLQIWWVGAALFLLKRKPLLRGAIR